MIFRRHPLPAFLILTLFASLSLSCGSTNQNSGRVLVAINVTPTTADAQNFPNGQVVFTATGDFSVPPLTGPVTFTAPYAGQFIVDNLNNVNIGSVVSSGQGTVTVQCVAGASGSVNVVATASANNGTSTTVSASGVLTCP